MRGLLIYLAIVVIAVWWATRAAMHYIDAHTAVTTLEVLA